MKMVRLPPFFSANAPPQEWQRLDRLPSLPIQTVIIQTQFIIYQSHSGFKIQESKKAIRNFNVISREKLGRTQPGRRTAEELFIFYPIKRQQQVYKYYPIVNTQYGRSVWSLRAGTKVYRKYFISKPRTAWPSALCGIWLTIFLVRLSLHGPQLDNGTTCLR